MPGDAALQAPPDRTGRVAVGDASGGVGAGRWVVAEPGSTIVWRRGPGWRSPGPVRAGGGDLPRCGGIGLTRRGPRGPPRKRDRPATTSSPGLRGSDRADPGSVGQPRRGRVDEVGALGGARIDLGWVWLHLRDWVSCEVGEPAGGG